MKNENQQSETIEENSGHLCPGNKSLEPYIGTKMNLEEKEFQNEAILVEIATNNTFAFKYEKKQSVVFGKCEWCNLKTMLSSQCACKNARYCDDICLDKDKRFHEPSCKA